jgi:F-type H+-transporting ATPase subunit epsilon
VTATRDVEVATREAFTGDDLATLDETVLTRFRTDSENERTERAESAKLQLSAIREIVRHLRSGSDL